ITSPTPGTTLSSSTMTFAWTSGAGVSQYWLHIGNTFAGNDLYNQSQGTNLSVAVGGLPTDGRTLYVRLWSLIGGAWQFNDYTYMAVTVAKAVITSPTPGTTLSSSTMTFAWTSGAGVSQYCLHIGNTFAGNDLYN